MGHTPGPWQVRNHPDFGHLLAVIAPQYRKECDANHVVCELRPWQRPDPDPNARLISAAPELLSALKVAAEFISGHNECLSLPSGSGDRQWNDYCIGLLEDCKAAIDKAEGRSE